MEDFSRFKKLKQRVNSTIIANRIVPENFLVSLISHYDAFLGSLIKALFHYNPEVLNSSEKKLTFSEILTFENLDNAKNYIIEKEIETILRCNHSEHFDWIEKKFKVELRKDLVLWSKFIEITERRNLFVHCSGIVSSQYLEICKKNGVELNPDIKVGNKLLVSEKYFKLSYETLFEIGVKLTNVLWRKLLPDDLDKADKHFNEICYDLISIGQYTLAIKLLDFATDILKKHAEMDKKVFIINRAQAYKWLGNQEEANRILNSEDWSACNNEFQLARSILQNNFTEALNIMKEIGKNSNLKMAYKEWPLFKEFRKEKNFKELYNKIFDEEFTITEFEDLSNNKIRGKENNTRKDIDKK